MCGGVLHLVRTAVCDRDLGLALVAGVTDPLTDGALLKDPRRSSLLICLLLMLCVT